MVRDGSISWSRARNRSKLSKCFILSINKCPPTLMDHLPLSLFGNTFNCEPRGLEGKSKSFEFLYTFSYFAGTPISIAFN